MTNSGLQATCDVAVAESAGNSGGSSTIRIHDDSVSRESAIAISIGGISYAVMMATPTDLEDFGLGFALSEGIIHSPEECYGIDVTPLAGIDGATVNLHIHGARAQALKTRQRNLLGPSGCGLCGQASVDGMLSRTVVIKQALVPERDAVLRAVASFSRQQDVQATTGTMHAAAWADSEGNILAIREDVGRHNALDKLIGALARKGGKAEKDRIGFAVLSSRGSYELVAKAAQSGIPALVTVSGATSMAVSEAQRGNVCLIGFARGERYIQYHPVDAKVAVEVHP